MMERWVCDNELRQIPTSPAWNDRQAELSKAFHRPETTRDYLTHQTTLQRQFNEVLGLAAKYDFKPHGIGIDLGAGTCWASAWFSNFQAIDCIYAVDISVHRLTEFAPLVLQSFKADPTKVKRVLGDFNNLQLPAGSVDFVFMAQTLHHAASASELLKEVRRVLKPLGFVFIIGEEPVTSFMVWRRRIRLLLTDPQRAFQDFHVLFTVDEWGDHYYRPKDYAELFNNWLWEWKQIGKNRIFLLWSGKEK